MHQLKQLNSHDSSHLEQIRSLQKLRTRLFIKQSLTQQQKSKTLFPKTQILNSLFPLTFPATKQKKKKKNSPRFQEPPRSTTEPNPQIQTPPIENPNS